MQPSDAEKGAESRDRSGDSQEDVKEKDADGTIAKAIQCSDVLGTDGPPSPTSIYKGDPEDLVKSESEATSGAIDKLDSRDDEYPDGGARAWLVLFGVCTTLICFCQ